MSEKRVKLNQIVKNQLPSYVQEDFPLVGEFLSQYYQGQEYQGGPVAVSYTHLRAHETLR